MNALLGAPSREAQDWSSPSPRLHFLHDFGSRIWKPGIYLTPCRSSTRKAQGNPKYWPSKQMTRPGKQTAGATGLRDSAPVTWKKQCSGPTPLAPAHHYPCLLPLPAAGTLSLLPCLTPLTTRQSSMIYKWLFLQPCLPAPSLHLLFPSHPPRLRSTLPSLNPRQRLLCVLLLLLPTHQYSHYIREPQLSPTVCWHYCR